MELARLLMLMAFVVSLLQSAGWAGGTSGGSLQVLAVVLCPLLVAFDVLSSDKEPGDGVDPLASPVGSLSALPVAPANAIDRLGGRELVWLVVGESRLRCSLIGCGRSCS